MLLPKRLMLGVSFVQGVLLFWLYRRFDMGLWPENDPAWLFPILTFLLVTPVFFLLVAEEHKLKALLRFLIPYSFIAMLMAAFSGYQLEPVDFVIENGLSLVFILTLGIASFKALMYSQEYSSNKEFSYASLLHSSWRNFLVMGFSLLFLILFFGVLSLWAALFKLIEISFFERLFEDDMFIFPVYAMAFGLAIIIFRSLSNIVDSVSSLLTALIKLLLPMLAGIIILFLMFLPFQGLQPLWDTNYGSGILLWLQALTLFGVNAVYQSNREKLPYPLIVHRFIYTSIALLPLYSMMVFYGMLTRIAQYGFTPSRCWALIVAILVCGFALGYLWSIIRKKDQWLDGLAWVNIRMGLVIMALMVLVNTPLLNLQRISAHSQLARHYSGDVSFEDLDLIYLRWRLGRQGYLALEELQERYTESEPGYAQTITEIMVALPANRFFANQITIDELPQAQLKTWPTGRELPAAALESILSRSIVMSDTTVYALFIDINDDGNEEIFTMYDRGQYLANDFFWVQEGNEWISHPYRWNNSSTEKFIELMNNNEISVEAPQWQDVHIGDIIIQVINN